MAKKKRKKECVCLKIFIESSLFFFLCFLGLYLQHMEVPRLGVKSELQLPACAKAMATWDPSHLRPTPQLMAVLDP